MTSSHDCHILDGFYGDVGHVDRYVVLVSSSRQKSAGSMERTQFGQVAQESS